MVRFAYRSVLFALGALSVSAIVVAQTSQTSSSPSANIDSGFRRVATIPMDFHGNFNFDISWVDPGNARYYLADRSSKSIDVVDTRTNKLIHQIAGFVGQSPKGPKSFGPSGMTVIPELNQAWAGDGDSSVKVVDLQSQRVVDSISTGGSARADELAYDDRDQIVVIGNDADDPPFLTFISTQPGHKVLGRLPLPQASDGLEQPVWHRATGLFYVAVPATKTNPGGEVDAIDPKTMTIARVYPTESCNPHGLALGPSRYLLIGCRTKALIMNLLQPDSTVTISQAGGSDEVWFNPGDDKYFLSGAQGGLKIIDALTNTWLGNVETGPGAHSVAADPITNQVYVPIAANPKDPACMAGCIAVFANPKER